ncbi:DNA topoisomerase VI subunit B [Marchantia polymorpha subsp. ruderalis]|uniref:DNA topoisomerase 6 subunit B n=1 Tax=Marchantia polymorpha TaxID=3197 RepID=A0A2R6X1R7_MARPO|nr:hypothetical protein MARPO_0042s0060 [Marchantia polymorpha]BBN02322.1 hypothetical protein Mp_2g14330 [Marchantia polymorpha subsp. ruderalis]|eukprot:PTQ40021.1 hypothetical protein MARPO_0042s0060 [Marchantia polymorpha]
MVDDKPAKGKAGKASTKDSVLKQKSPAEFFSENKNIAGFDNPGKSLYTTVRELVENALDSAESIAELPAIEVTIEEYTKAKADEVFGIKTLERKDEKLYDDYETEKAREKRLAKEAKDQEKQAKALAAGKKVNPSDAKLVKGRDTPVFKVTCKDNGKGMPHDDIPNMLGRVLSGTKYGLKQTRGKFGLGAKMALIWAKMSTGQPIDIWSSTEGQSFTTYCRLDIDIHKNVPHVHVHEKRPNTEKWRGAELQVTIAGNWSTYRSKIINYMRQMAVITPYAQFIFRYIGPTADKNVTIRFARRTDVMPAAPQETRFHPSAVDLLLIKRLIAETTKTQFIQFLQQEFVGINKPLAQRLIEELGPEFNQKMSVKSLTGQQILCLHQLFRQAKFDDPDGDCLSPAGEYNLRLGIMKELHPDMVATYQGSPQVFEGHPFIVEAGVSLGGKDVKPGVNVFRFANRIPLLFEQGGDVVTRTAMKRINWNSYKINQAQDKIGVFVSIVSTKIPFKGTGKEYIGDDVTEMATAVKSALQQCCIQLKGKIVRQQQARDRQLRKRSLAKYIPDVSRAIYDVLSIIAEGQKAKRARYGDTYVDMLNKVALQAITEATVKQKLTQHVEQVDAEMALEYAIQTGMVDTARETVYLRTSDRNRPCAIELHSPVCVIKLFSGF